MIDALQPRDGVVVVWTNHQVHGTDEVYLALSFSTLRSPAAAVHT